MLGIAYAASIGSLGTIIGTPPNGLLVSNLEAEGVSIGFGQWMLFGVPIAAAAGLGVDPMLLAIPVALAATSAFMLPVATPPNAIAFGSGYVRMGEMIRAGVVLNIVGMVLITVAMFTLAGPIFGVSF